MWDCDTLVILRRDDRVGRMVDDAMEAIVKRAVLSPSWMKAAWSQEVENLKAFGATPEELLVEVRSHLPPTNRGTLGMCNSLAHTRLSGLMVLLYSPTSGRIANT